jgi:rhamnosyl/mannosyltransferase
VKVLHFYKTYFPDSQGGVQQVIFQLAEGGRPYGIDAQVLFLSDSGSNRNAPCANHLTHSVKQDFQLASSSFSWSVFTEFAELASSVDLIHYHFPWPFMDVVHFASRLHKPFVVTYHSDIVKQKYLLKLYGPLMKRFLAQADAIVATSPNYVQSSAILSKLAPKVIPIGIDPASYPRVSDTVVARWRARFPGRFFLYVGALRYYKGLDYLLEACCTTPYPVVILGGGLQESALKHKAQALGLDNVHFLGVVSDIDKIALLQLCLALVFPSHLRSEAFGVSLLEASMSGKPMITCEIGTGTSYVNLAGSTGLVVPPADPTALSQAMSALWNDPVMADRMGQDALQRFEQLFTAKAMAERYAQLYTEVLGRA